MKQYESIFVLKPEINDKKVNEQIEKVREFIEKNNGRITAVEKWGKKKLAYLVKKNRFGIYILIRFESEPGLISNLQRNYKLNEDIIRYMTVLYREIAKKSPASAEAAEQQILENAAVGEDVAEEVV